jgi:hypothetical protein
MLRRQDCRACITVESYASTPRRSVRLDAYLVMTPPAREATKLPPLPPPTHALLQALGKVRRERHELIANTEESMRPTLEPGAVASIELAQAQLQTIELPFPDLEPDRWREQGEAFGSFKDELIGLLPSYRYDSKRGMRGVWVLAKRTALGNELSFAVDRGPLGGDAKATLSISSALWSHSVRLPASRTRSELCVWRAETMASLCRNWVAATEVFERTWLSQVEQLYVPGYAWYEPR